MPTIDCIGEKRNMSMSLRHSPSSTLIYHREGVSTTLTQRAIGTYNPDWAIVFKGEKKIYFVAETKGDKDQELRPSAQINFAFHGIIVSSGKISGRRIQMRAALQ